MASNTKSSAPTAPFPTTNGTGPSKDDIINDLRRQLEESDISSNAGSNSSGRRRRRRKNKSSIGQPLRNTAAPVVPKISDTKPVRLQLGLNLDVELELKARIQGDVTLTLLIEKHPPNPSLLTHGKQAKFSTSKTSSFTTNEVLSKSRAGETEQKLEIFEMCYMRLGKLRFRQHWVQREVSESLTAAVIFCVSSLGIFLGFMGGWMAATKAAGSCQYMPVMVG